MSATTVRLPSRYRDLRPIARGGMGEVYRATDSTLNRTVAVKVLDNRFEHDDVHRRFMREGLAAARLSSGPSTVTIYDVGECDGRPFIVMEYVPGGSLEGVLARDGAQEPGRALEWLHQAAQALDHAHAHGVVHRDVKPANLLLGSDGSIRVADFGVASAAGLDSFTQTGTVIGTAGYLSPEQAAGKEATPASDRYALGVVAYELLTGSRPFQRSSPTAEAAAHIREPAPPVSERRPGLPAALDAVFDRALAKDPAERPGSARELVAALAGALADDAGPTRVMTPPPARAPRTAHRRGRALPFALLAAILLAAGVVAAVLLAHRGGKSTAPPKQVVTVTAQGTTVQQTITAAAQPPATTAAPATTTTPSGGSAASEGYSLMQAGNYAGALPLLRRAAGDLQGSGGMDEAYNDYNLAFTLVQVQGCSQEVLDLLDASQAIQGHRKEIDRLRKACRHEGD